MMVRRYAMINYTLLNRYVRVVALHDIYSYIHWPFTWSSIARDNWCDAPDYNHGMHCV